MPSAPKLDAPQGQPLFDVQFRAISESLAGNGVLSNGDLEVTDGTNALEIDVAAGTLYYVATEYTYAGASPAATLSGGDGTYDRWDTVAFDTGTSSVVVHEGTPEQYPTPPGISGGEVLLAIVYVASGATDIAPADILNWRAKFSNEAEEVHYNDSTGDYGVDNVDAALDAIDLDFVRGRDNTITGQLAGLGTNPGVFGAVVDMVVDGNSAAGTEHSFLFAADGTTLLKCYVESDGAGGIQNAQLDIAGTALVDGTTTLYEPGNGWFRNEVVQGLRNLTADEAFSGHPIGASDIGSGVVGTSELDLTIAPTWTGIHTFDDTLTAQEIATPTAPPAGYDRLYFKTDGLLYKQNDAGTESTVGALTLEDDQTTVLSATEAVSAGRALTASDDGDGTGSVDYDFDNVFNGEAGASGLANGNQLLIERTSLADQETLAIYECSLTLSAAQASSSGMDLELVTFAGDGTFTSQVVLIAGDGATVFDEVTGSPVGSYQNTSGGDQTVGVIADNGTGASEDVHGSAEGVVE